MIEVEVDPKGAITEREVNDDSTEKEGSERGSALELLSSVPSGNLSSEDEGDISSAESYSSREEQPELMKQWSQDLQRLQLRISQVLREPAGEQKDLGALEQDFKVYRQKWNTYMARLNQEPPKMEVPTDLYSGPSLAPPLPAMTKKTPEPQPHPRPFVPGWHNHESGLMKGMIFLFLLMLSHQLFFNSNYKDQKMVEDLAQFKEHLLDEVRKCLQPSSCHLSQEEPDLKTDIRHQLEFLSRRQKVLEELLAHQQEQNFQMQFASMSLSLNQLNESFHRMKLENGRWQMELMRGILVSLSSSKPKAIDEDIFSMSHEDLEFLLNHWLDDYASKQRSGKQRDFESRLKTQVYDLYHNTKISLATLGKSMVHNLQHLFSDDKAKPDDKDRKDKEETEPRFVYPPSIKSVLETAVHSLEEILENEKD